MACKWQVEINDYCNKVLAKHWPDVRRYKDVKECGKHNLEPVDVISGGSPCQPHSVAGKRRGAADDRNLWPEFLRIVREVRPTWVVAENVHGIVSLYLDTVLSDLEGECYTCWTFNIPACAFDAPHRRERIFVVAHAESEQDRRIQFAKLQPNTGAVGKDVSNPQLNRLEEPGNGRIQGRKADTVTNAGWWTVEPSVGGVVARISPWMVEPDIPRVAKGVPDRVNKLRALGNAVVPAVAQYIGERIVECHLANIHEQD